jgi:hypothetical protein
MRNAWENPPPEVDKKVDLMCYCWFVPVAADCENCMNTGWTPCPHEEL